MTLIVCVGSDLMSVGSDPPWCLLVLTLIVSVGSDPHSVCVGSDPIVSVWVLTP